MKNTLIKTYISVTILILISLVLFAYNKNLNISPSKSLLLKEPLLEQKINIRKKVETNNSIKLNEELNFFLSSFQNSSYFPGKDGTINVILPTNNKRRGDAIYEKLKEGALNYNKIKDYNIFIVDFNYELLKSIIKNKDSILNVLQYTEQKSPLNIEDYNLYKFFSEETINNGFEKDKNYFTDKKKTIFIKTFLSEKIKVGSVYNMDYKYTKKRDGFEITEKSYPIISISKYKILGNGILSNKYNKKQKETISKIYNNIDEIIQDPNYILRENENKRVATELQSISEFTELKYKKYLDYYILNNKDFKVINHKNNKVLLENNKEYRIVYLDKDNIYPFNKKQLPSKGKTYIFENVSYIKPIISLGEKLYKKTLEELKNKGYNIENLEAQMVVTKGGNIKAKY